MSWQLNEKECSAVTALSAFERYSYFLKKVADENRLWSLWWEGWVHAEDCVGKPLIVVWPHRKYAVSCVSADWSGCVAKEIELSAWIDQVQWGIENGNMSISVFPTSTDKGKVVSPSQLCLDLNEETSSYR